MIRDLNNPESHDGTQQKHSFGGPYHLYVSLNGEVLFRGEVQKGDQLNVTFEPLGETENVGEAVE